MSCCRRQTLIFLKSAVALGHGGSHLNKEPDTLSCESCYATEKDKSILTLRLKQCLFTQGLEIHPKQQLLKQLDEISADPEINVLLIICEQEKKGISEYIRLCDTEHCTDKDEFYFHRFQNAVSDITLKIANLNKFVIFADHREEIPLFLNLSFACDFRIYKNNFSFYNPYLDSNLAPRGGEVFFLSRLLGYKKTMDLFLSNSLYSAEDALQMGLVDDLVDPVGLEAFALGHAHEFAKKPPSLVSALKNLLNGSLQNLNDCLEIEKKMHIQLRNKGLLGRFSDHS